MNTDRLADLRSERVQLVNDRDSFAASALWWRHEATQAPTEFIAAHARQAAGRLELKAHALGDDIQAIDKQIAELDGVASPYAEASVVLGSDQMAAVDDTAGLEVSA